MDVSSSICIPNWPHNIYVTGIICGGDIDLVVIFSSLVVKMGYLVVILIDLVVKIMGLVVIVKMWNII